jgi:FkbM family methyltransferase
MPKVDTFHLLAALAHMRRAPEVIRCQRETRQWLPVTLSYLGLSTMSFPFSLEMRGMSPVLLGEPYDLKTFWQVFLHRCYPVRSTDRSIIDAGANIGLFSLYAARQAPNAKILAIEPFPATFERLCQAVRRHGLGDRVECMNCALCGSEGPRMMKPTNQPSQMQRVATGNVQGGISVPAQTLGGIIDGVSGEVDLLKMDIEGSEYEVLLNTASSDLRRVRRVVLEYHGDVEPYTRAQLFSYLAAAGFDVCSDHHDKLNYGVVEMVRRSN